MVCSGQACEEKRRRELADVPADFRPPWPQKPQPEPPGEKASYFDYELYNEARASARRSHALPQQGRYRAAATTDDRAFSPEMAESRGHARHRLAALPIGLRPNYNGIKFIIICAGGATVVRGLAVHLFLRKAA